MRAPRTTCHAHTLAASSIKPVPPSQPKAPRPGIVSRDIAPLEVPSPQAIGLGAEQIREAFTIFDDLIPKLGIYQRAIKLLRDELFDAIHSHEYTTNSLGEMQRLPYSDVVGRIMRSRNEKALSLQEKLSKAEATIADLLEQIKERDLNAGIVRESLAETQAKLEHASATIIDRDNTINSLMAVAEQREQAGLLKAKQYEARIAALQAELVEAHKETDQAISFKKAYEKLQATFDDERLGRVTRRTAEPNLRDIAKLALDESKKMEKQLLEVRRRAMEQFDEQVVVMKNGEKEHSQNAVQQAQMQGRFRKNMDEINKELKLNIENQASYVMLLRFSHISPYRPYRAELQLYTATNRNQEEFETSGKFRDQIPLLNKLCSTVYISTNGGLSFNPLEGSTYCHRYVRSVLL